MGRHQKMISLDQDAKDLLDENPDDNHSEIIRELLKVYYQDGIYNEEEAAARVKRRRLEAKKEQKRAEIKALDGELDRLEKDVEERVPADEEIRNRYKQQFETVSAEYRSVDNPLVQDAANEMGIPPEDVLDWVDEEVPAPDTLQLKSVGGR